MKHPYEARMERCMRGANAHIGGFLTRSPRRLSQERDAHGSLLHGHMDHFFMSMKRNHEYTTGYPLDCKIDG